MMYKKIMEVYPCDKCSHIRNNHDTFINSDKEICWCGCQNFYINNLKYLEQIYEKKVKANG